MKVTIRNLGIIEEAEIDLKPLTTFVGPNNAGKTWLAYTLAGIFGTYGFVSYYREYSRVFDEGTPNIYLPLEEAIWHILKNGGATIDLVQFADEYAEVYFNNVANYFAQRLMPEFMSTQIASFEQLSISINFAETKAYYLERLKMLSLKSELSVGEQYPLISINKKRGDKKLRIYTSTEHIATEYTSTEEEIAEPLPKEVIKEFVINTILRTLHRSLYLTIRVLPTERTTFITFPFGSRVTPRGRYSIKEQTIDREPSIQEEKSSQKQKMKAMIGPVNYFLEMVRTIFENESAGAKQREKDAKNNPQIKKYVELAQLLEKQILSGEVKFLQAESNVSLDISQSELDMAQEILFQPTKDNQLEISIASSMAKELSPLVLYLRYLAKPGELLIIDEPEMNLHPEAQVKIIELIAMLIDAGLNVLITTHSPYIIDHLTNLMKAAEHEDKESIRREFYLKSTDAFISKDKVSIYLFDQGHVTKGIDENNVIQLNTFGEVSDRLSEIYFKL